VASAIGVPGIMHLALGDLVVGHQMELVLRVRFPDLPQVAHTTAFFTIADCDGVLKADGCILSWAHASHATNDAQPRDREVDSAVAQTAWVASRRAA
jgi:hypothetical protein